MPYQAPRGTNDILPVAKERWLESSNWTWIEEQFFDLAALYGYQVIRTPIFEETAVFTRAAGDTSEVVTKQMYDFVDKGGRNISLKPEGTAAIMRSLIEHSLVGQGSVTRLSYFTHIFRYERPQKGRYRQAHQLGLELVGVSSPAADAEIIKLTYDFYKELGLKELTVSLNSIGRGDCRKAYETVILDKVSSWMSGATEEAQAQARKNPLRLLDSKDPAVQECLKGIPPITNYLEPESAERFKALQGYLEKSNVEFKVDPTVVRGLDYYTETVFEVHSTSLGAQTALCGGGRYDDLVKQMGGPDTPCVGMALGIERALLVLEQQELLPPAKPVSVFAISAEESTFEDVMAFATTLREAGISTLLDLDAKSMRSQLRQADKVAAPVVAIIGGDEKAAGEVTLKQMSSGDQVRVPIKEAEAQIRKWL